MISLFAGEERSAKRERLGDPLQVLDRHIDFAALAKAQHLPAGPTAIRYESHAACRPQLRLCSAFDRNGERR